MVAIEEIESPSQTSKFKKRVYLQEIVKNLRLLSNFFKKWLDIMQKHANCVKYW